MEETLEKHEKKINELRSEVEGLKWVEMSQFKGDMIEEKEQMEKWKGNWEKKKEEIGKMKKIKVDGEKDYQGEFKNGKSNGFGILIAHSGEFKGNRYEGEWKEGKYSGKGIYY